MVKIIDLFHEFQDFFSTKFAEMKWILGDLGEMKFPLKLDAKPIKQHMYRLIPRHKERVNSKFDGMLDVGIIKPMEES